MCSRTYTCSMIHAQYATVRAIGKGWSDLPGLSDAVAKVAETIRTKAHRAPCRTPEPSERFAPPMWSTQKSRQ